MQKSKKMKIDPKRLADHLSRIYIHGQIKEVVLRGQFEAVALNQAYNLLVRLPRLQGEESLPEEIGIPNLPRLIWTLRYLAECEELAAEKAGREPDRIELSLSPSHLVLEGKVASKWKEESWEPGTSMPMTTRGVSLGGKGVFNLKRAHPKYIMTGTDPEKAREILQNFLREDGEPINLLAWDSWRQGPIEEEGAPPRTGALAALPPIIRLYKPETVKLKIGPEGGEFILHGTEPDIEPVYDVKHGLRAPKAYELEFKARMFASVLLQVRKSPSMRIHLSGPGNPVLFADEDGYSYLVSPERTLLTNREELEDSESGEVSEEK